jgi:hypothetical protein
VGRSRRGCRGVLFEPGNSGTTAIAGGHDRITNSVPISVYGCARCNTQVSDYPDDDDGYLRLQLGRYYTHNAYPPARCEGAAPRAVLP